MSIWKHNEVYLTAKCYTLQVANHGFVNEYLKEICLLPRADQVTVHAYSLYFLWFQNIFSHRAYIIQWTMKINICLMKNLFLGLELIINLRKLTENLSSMHETAGQKQCFTDFWYWLYCSHYKLCMKELIAVFCNTNSKN